MSFVANHEAHPDMPYYQSNKCALSQTTVLTPSQFREQLAKQGISFVQFCADKKIPYRAAFAVLSGTVKATRGKSHGYAVLMGLKESA